MGNTEIGEDLNGRNANTQKKKNSGYTQWETLQDHNMCAVHGMHHITSRIHGSKLNMINHAKIFIYNHVKQGLLENI